MGQALSLPFRIAKTTATYYGGLFFYLFGKGRNTPYDLGDASNFPYLRPNPSDTNEESLFKQYARIHLSAWRRISTCTISLTIAKALTETIWLIISVTWLFQELAFLFPYLLRVDWRRLGFCSQHTLQSALFRLFTNGSSLASNRVLAKSMRLVYLLLMIGSVIGDWTVTSWGCIVYSTTCRKGTKWKTSGPFSKKARSEKCPSRHISILQVL